MTNFDFNMLRRRQDEVRRLMESAGAAPSSPGAVYVGEICNGGAIPTAVPRVYMTKPVRTVATEDEGQTPTFTVGGCEIPVLILGPRIPVAGEKIVCRAIQGLWVGLPSKTSAPAETCLTCLDAWGGVKLRDDWGDLTMTKSGSTWIANRDVTATGFGITGIRQAMWNPIYWSFVLVPAFGTTLLNAIMANPPFVDADYPDYPDSQDD
jgi:hypothetical protein